MLEAADDEDAALAADAIDLESSLQYAEASPVVALVDRILLQAMSVGASDIHVEPQQKGLRLRYRQDGVLQQYVEPLPGRLIPAVTSRFKILADLDIAERRQAQDGRICSRYRKRVVDFRVNTLPSRFGEKICLRLLDSSATQLGLDKLISNPTTLELVRDLGAKPFGMILVTGPTGSGKSTTLYSLFPAGGTQRPRNQYLHSGGSDRIHAAGHHPVPGESRKGVRLRHRSEGIHAPGPRCLTRWRNPRSGDSQNRNRGCSHRTSGAEHLACQ